MSAKATALVVAGIMLVPAALSTARIAPAHAAKLTALARAGEAAQPRITVGSTQHPGEDEDVPGLVDLYAKLPGDEVAAGTGLVVSADGEVITNNHVIAGGQRIGAALVSDGHVYPVQVLGTDPHHDVAVLRLTGATGLVTAAFGDSDQVRVGDRVITAGNVGGSGGAPTITDGAVTALNQVILAENSESDPQASDTDNGTDSGDGSGTDSGDDSHGGAAGDTAAVSRPVRGGQDSGHVLHGMIEVDARVRPGDSGGPLLTPDGLVIGMDTAADRVHGFAIPINTVLRIARRLGGPTTDPGQGPAPRWGLGGSGSGPATPPIRLLPPTPAASSEPPRRASGDGRAASSRRGVGLGLGGVAGVRLGGGAR